MRVLPSYLISLTYLPGTFRELQKEKLVKRLKDSKISPPSLLFHSSNPSPPLQPRKSSLVDCFLSIHEHLTSITSHLPIPICRYNSIRFTRSLHCTVSPKHLQSFLPHQYEAADNNAIWHWPATRCRRPQDPRVSRYCISSFPRLCSSGPR